MLFRRRRQLICQQMVELVTEYLDGVMEPKRRARFEAHLAGCDGCTNYIEQFRTTLVVVGRSLEVDDVPEPVMSGLLSAFRNWADDHDGGA
jgi:anti-sigma factor RsiW